MADPVIGATVQVVLDKLLSLTIEEAKKLRNCKKDLRMLTNYVSMIQAFIHDAEGRQVKHQPVEKWLKMLEGVAEDAEYVFDEFRYESLKAQVMKNRTKIMEKVSQFFSHTAFKYNMSRKIKNINEQLREINQLAAHLGLEKQIPSQHILPTRETDSLVVDGRQPHPNLKMLEVENYLGTKFPSWLSDGLLPNLVKLKLSRCRRCKEIPLLGQLKSLQNLELVGFNELECIGPALYGAEISNIGSSRNIQVFPSLKELVLRDMLSLTEWKGDEVGVRMFPRLEKLRIKNCPLLKSTPSQFEILRELEIERVDSAMPLLNLCSNLTSLVELSVNNVEELTCLPDEMLHNNVSLQHLKVYHCPNFSSFPVPSGENYLTSLQSFELEMCNGVTNLPSGMLEQCRSLHTLSVCRCNNLDSLPLHVWEMPSLFCLYISECPKLITVPTGGLHLLTGLQRLEIGPFSEMVDFEAFQLIFNGIRQLSSLRSLLVHGHGHWDSLPYQLMELSDLKIIVIRGFGMEALPDMLRNLTSLERLSLYRCNRLQYVDFSDAILKLRSLYIFECASLEALSDGLWNC